MVRRGARLPDQVPLWGFRGLTFIKHLHLPIKHTVLFPLIDTFLQVKKKKCGVRGNASKSQGHVCLCFLGASPAEVPKARTVPSHLGRDNSLSASVYAKEVPDPLRQPELDYPIWYLIPKSCKHTILHSCFFRAAKLSQSLQLHFYAKMHILQ